MIIGNNNDFNSNLNNNFLNNNFPNRNQTINQPDTSLLTGDLSTFAHTNPMDNNQMYDKSLAMLKERYDKKLISLDEFSKGCEQIRKNRQQDNNLF